ncbi:hypothetical protein [Rothia endophytica]|uniref:Aminoglycoside phosphotransferase n=1 Tax=Rothia endophytica TaxID=1324766 RepID=A0ABP9BSZ0_9MICC|nr:Uncharacterised protein [Mycobacteroides abscessus subsp. bolletii]
MTLTETAPRQSERTTVSATGLLITEKWSAGGQEGLVRTLGDSAPLPFSSAVLEPQQKQASVLVWGRGNIQERFYPLTKHTPLYNYLIETEVQDSLDYRTIGKAWGSALREMHQLPVLGEALPTSCTPRTAVRSYHWLNDEGWEHLTKVLATEHFEKLRQWIEAVTRGENLAVSHGNAGFINWLISADQVTGVLLTGEDVGYAQPEYDTGWVLGEFAELYAFYPNLRLKLTDLQQGFLTGYGDFTENNLNSAIAFRLIHHAYDWHHYAGANLQAAQLLIDLATNYLDR